MHWTQYTILHEVSALRLARYKREHTQRAAGAAYDLERRGDDYGPSWGQLVEVDQARDAEFARTVHRRMVGEWGVEATRLPGVRSDGLHPDAQHVALAGEELRALLRECG